MHNDYDMPAFVCVASALAATGYLAPARGGGATITSYPNRKRGTAHDARVVEPVAATAAAVLPDCDDFVGAGRGDLWRPLLADFGHDGAVVHFCGVGPYRPCAHAVVVCAGGGLGWWVMWRPRSGCLCGRR